MSAARKTRRPARPDAQKIVVERAGRALGKIAHDPLRGPTNVTLAEVKAMAAMLEAFGLVSIPPGAPTPDALAVKLPKGWIVG
ncbi:hypothetical protein [Cognatishimia sp. MH4019]|uniref:hypothetical protein n=1 Tax=Cognatishimia sp. MH4019 TaxID=2854030 RepID=UPI001CD358BA|nr:hypothetical protein [Cognatishimia sp. MH4019]